MKLAPWLGSWACSETWKWHFGSLDLGSEMVGTSLKLFQFEGSRASIFEQKRAEGWWSNHTKPVRNVILPCKCEKCHFSGAIFKLATVTWRQPFSFSWSPGNYHVSMILTKHSSFIVELGPWETLPESRNHILWFKIPWSMFYCLLQAAQAAVWDPKHHHSSRLQRNGLPGRAGEPAREGEELLQWRIRTWLLPRPGLTTLMMCSLPSQACWTRSQSGWERTWNLKRV